MIRRLLLLLALLLLPAHALAAGGMVSAADPRAAEAGREILRAGGSATDAAMAMMLALTVVEPQSSGIGGGGFLVHNDAAGRIGTIDGRETAPAAALPSRFLAPDGAPMAFPEAFRGGLSVGVPGNIRLMAKAHARWGKLPWAALFQPAIRLAEQGFALSGSSARALERLGAASRDFAELRALYWDKDAPKPAGSLIRNPALAALLRDIAAKGPDAFYTGPAAQAIVAAVAAAPRNPAILTAADLAAYQAKERPAICGRYHAYRVCGMGPPSSGAITILQMLAMLERFDLAALGPQDARAWHLIGEAMQLAYADRDTYLGDRDFVSVPVAGLIDPAYLARRSRLIAIDRALGRYEAGAPPAALAMTTAPASEVPSTTHFVAVDGDGNVASMTSTVEGPFGSQLIANGMVLNNELTDFSFAPEKDGKPVANRVEAGKRPLSSMAPTIVYDANGKVVLALGSAGGRRIIMHVAKTLIGVLDWKLPAQQAIALPNIFFSKDGLLVEKGSALEAQLPALARYGRPVVAAELTSKVNAVERTPTGWRGAADPRSEGVALAE